MNQPICHRILRRYQFRMIYLLALGMEDHWARALSLVPCGRDGIPVVPGACHGWTLALIESMARATVTDHPDPVYVPGLLPGGDPVVITGASRDGRVSWHVSSSGFTALRIHQPVAAGDDPNLSVVLSVTLEGDGQRLAVWDLPGHPQAHQTAQATVDDLVLLVDVLSWLTPKAHEDLSSAIVQHRGEAHGNHLIVQLQGLNRLVSQRMNNGQNPYGKV